MPTLKGKDELSIKVDDNIPVIVLRLSSSYAIIFISFIVYLLLTLPSITSTFFCLLHTFPVSLAYFLHYFDSNLYLPAPLKSLSILNSPFLFPRLYLSICHLPFHLSRCRSNHITFVIHSKVPQPIFIICFNLCYSPCHKMHCIIISHAGDNFSLTCKFL